MAELEPIGRAHGITMPLGAAGCRTLFNHLAALIFKFIETIHL